MNVDVYAAINKAEARGEGGRVVLRSGRMLSCEKVLHSCRESRMGAVTLGSESGAVVAVVDPSEIVAFLPD